MDVNSFWTSSGFCHQTAAIFQFIGYIVMVFKILIPVILIVIGIIALGKAVISDDDKEIKTAVNKLIKKFIVAVFVFFIPSIVSAVFSLVSSFNEVKPDYTVCIDCITSPRKCSIPNK